MDFNHQVFDWIYKNLYSKLLFRSKEVNMISYEVVFKKGKVRLLHYLNKDRNGDYNDNNNLQKSDKFPNNQYNDNIQLDKNVREINSTNIFSDNKIIIPDQEPLLIIYASINRFHILNLNRQKSVVTSLVSNNIDVYLLDCGFPTLQEEEDDDYDITLKLYLDFIDESIKNNKSTYDKQEEESKKISILGYCRGGIISLIYTSLKQENIKK